MDTKPAQAPSPLWHQALEKYRDELQGSGDYGTIQKIQSLDQLLESFSSMQATVPSKDAGLLSLQRIAPRLKFVDDFSAVLALCFGADASLIAAIWGSIRLILAHASSAAETLQDVLDILEELSLTLPRFQVYEKTLPLTRPLQQALVDVYCEVICFYARAIHFLSNNPHLVLRKTAWQTFHHDFSRTMLRIKRMSSTVEREAELARMRQDSTQYKEVVELLSAMKLAQKDAGQARYNNVPYSVNGRFTGREDILEDLDKLLDPGTPASSPKSMALFGMGGAGKTQIALQYAHRSSANFDVVLWVAAESPITIGQSFRSIAEGLKLLGSEDETKDGAAAMYQVKTWLASASSTCLLILDNADDLTSVKTAWQVITQGSILLTTRDFTVASSLASQHAVINAFGVEDGGEMLLNTLDIGQPSATDKEQALHISKAFGGFPLALSQVGGFIRQRRMALKDFLPLYERYSGKIDGRKAPGSDYEHTLSTVWDVSFQRLSENSALLLNLLAFLDPDGVAEHVLLEGSQELEGEFLFLSDELDLSDASEELLRAALVDRRSDQATLSIHRLVQSTIRKRLDATQSAKLFDAVVQMLCWGFPDHSSKDIGHQISAWERCEMCLSHVNHLAGLAKSSDFKPSDRKRYGDLLLRCSWYLYEREMYTIAKTMVEQAVSTIEDQESLEYASAIDLGGLLDLDLANAASALEPFKRALKIRQTILGDQDPFIAYSLNNIALAYTELDELQLAYDAHQEAIRLRLEAKSDRIGNSYSNMASLLLRMGRPDEAEEMLARCPSLKDFTDETFLSTGNPRFSGDMVLLSRIRLAQGRTTDALRLATKALAFRRKLLGNRLKTCDSQYDVACMLAQDGHTSSAIELLLDIVSISKAFVEGEGHRARALFKLSILYADRGASSESAECKSQALELYKTIKDVKDVSAVGESDFSRLCVWMLW